MRLESERLILRPWRPQDRKPFAAINAEPDVVRYLNPLTDEQSNAMLDRIDRHFEDHGWGSGRWKRRQAAS